MIDEAKIAFREIRKKLPLTATVVILIKTLQKTAFNKKKDEVEKQFLPIIHIYRHLLEKISKKEAIEVAGNIIVECGVLDISKSLPKLKKGEGLKEYLNLLKNSKYFRYSDYSIVEENDEEAKIIVKRCAYCNLFNKYNISELSPYLCKSDEVFFEKYNPNLSFILKKSIAKGDEFCEEIYRWRSSKV